MFGRTVAGVKQCGKCNVVRAEGFFHRSRRRGLQAWCKPCRKAYDAAYWRRNRERRQRQKRQNTTDFRAWYASLKAEKPCSDCGRVFAPAAMQWDHLPGADKVKALGDLVHRHNRALILSEIAKCELVCANCHAVRTLVRHGA